MVCLGTRRHRPHGEYQRRTTIAIPPILRAYRALERWELKPRAEPSAIAPYPRLHNASGPMPPRSSAGLTNTCHAIGVPVYLDRRVRSMRPVRRAQSGWVHRKR